MTGSVLALMTAGERDVFLMGFRKMQDAAHQNAVDHGWWEGEDHNDAEKIALMHSELSEALEALRSDSMDKHLPNRPGEEVELADVVIRIMDYAAQKGLDVAGAIVEKHNVNVDRPHKHGGKKF